MSENGRLPAGDLAAIPGGRLRKDAAQAWNAMYAYARLKGLTPPRPVGPRASYRTYGEQVMFWEAYRQGRGNLAARPGTSNHGWGLAVDVQLPQGRRTIDLIGAPFGWAKRWSDAQSEPWHIKWRPGVFKPTQRPLRHGATGHRVKVLQVMLRARGFKSVRVTGYYGAVTVSAVRRVQKRHHLKVDGIAGPATLNALRRNP